MSSQKQEYAERQDVSLLTSFVPEERKRYIIAPSQNQTKIIHTFCRTYGYTVTYRRLNGDVVCLPSEEAIRLEEMNEHLGNALTKLGRLTDSNGYVTPDQREWHDQIEGVRNAISVRLGIQ